MAEEFRTGTATNADGSRVPAALGRDGILLSREHILAYKLRGRVFGVQQGDAGSKLDFAEILYDEDQPQFALRVPTNIVVAPISLAITLEDLTGTENHVIWSFATNDIGSGTSTALTSFNMRPGASNPVSQCVARSLYTVNATAATGLQEFKRWYRPFASAAVTDGHKPEDYLLDILKDICMPVLVGPATLQVHIYGGTAPQGFGEYIWLELSKDDII